MRHTLIVACLSLCTLPAYSNNNTPPPAPTLLSSVDVPYAASIFTIVGDYAYVESNSTTITTINIADPNSIAVTGSLTAPDPLHTLDAFAHENALYIFSDHQFHIIDITTPESPAYAGAYLLPQNQAFNVATTHEDSMYLGFEDDSSQILDLTNPLTPTLITNLELDAPIAFIIDGLGYTTSFQPIDITDPINPVALAPAPFNNQYTHMVRNQNTVYAKVRGQNTGRPISIADPLAPSPLFQSNGFSYSEFTGFAVHGSLFYSINNAHSIGISDASYPQSVFGINSIQFDESSRFQHIDSKEDTTFILQEESFGAYKMFSAPTVASHHTLGAANDIMIDERDGTRTAILANDGGSLQFFDITDPTNLKLQTTFPLPDNAFAIDRMGDTLYVATERDNLNLVDISDLSNPTLIMNIDTGRKARDVLVKDDFLYVVDRVFGFSIYDITDPTAPEFLSITDTLGWATDITIDEEGTTAYIAHGNQPSFAHVDIFDITDPTAPTMIGVIDDIRDVDKVTLDGDLVYIAQGNFDYIIVDISDMAKHEYHMIQIDYNRLDINNAPGFAHEIQLVGDMLYLANGSGGFLTIYNANPFNPVANQWIQSTDGGTGASTRRFIVQDGLTYTAVHEGGFRIYEFDDLRFCPVDFNFDGQINFFDVDRFLDFLAKGQPQADLNGDQKFNFYDVAAFFDFYAQGCP